MKHKIMMGCVLAGGLLFASCSDFLEEDPKGKLTPGTFFSNVQEMNMAVYALYGQVTATQAYTNMQIPQWQGDDMTTNPGSNKQAYAEFDRFRPADDNKGLVACWNQHYNLIKACNYVALNAGKTPAGESEKNIAIGQAKYWRAYSYFTLVRIWGNLPLCLDLEIDYNKKLSSVDDVYASIVKDLEDCINILPVSYTEAPAKSFGADLYITKQAAQATLSAVYMAMAGYPLNKGKEYYKMAADQAKKVIDQNSTYGFILEPEFKNVYAPSHNYSKETIVGISYNKLGGWGTQGSQLTSCCLFESLGGWGDSWGEIRFWKEMPDGPRKDAIYAPKLLVGNKADGKLVDWFECKVDNDGNFVYRKDDKGNIMKDEEGDPIKETTIAEFHPMFSVFSVGAEEKTYEFGSDYADYDYRKPAGQGMINGMRHRIIRWSELLLWYAESQARAEGAPNNMAYNCVNEVRKRAGLDKLPVGMTGDDFANAVAKEHGWEVAGNWCALVTRRADQLRLNLLKTTFEERQGNKPVVVGKQNLSDGRVIEISAKEGVRMVDAAWNESMNYAPYPSADKAVNPELSGSK